MSTPSEKLATKVVEEMYENDAFSQWLGIERLYEDADLSIQMEVP